MSKDSATHGAMSAHTPAPQGIAIPRQRDIAVVYQGGLINVFHIPRGVNATMSKDTTGQWADRRRIFQGDYRTGESIAYGLGLAGRVVRSFGCNMAGDIALQAWTTELDDLPFCGQFHPQMWN